MRNNTLRTRLSQDVNYDEDVTNSASSWFDYNRLSRILSGFASKSTHLGLTHIARCEGPTVVMHTLESFRQNDPAFGSDVLFAKGDQAAREGSESWTEDSSPWRAGEKSWCRGAVKLGEFL